MPGYKLLYFNVRGKAEMMRYLFTDQEIEHEVQLYDRDTWPEIKSQMEFGQLPCLRHGDFQIVQSCAIMRYLARKHGLYGENDMEASVIDMIMDGQEDLRTKYIRMIYQNYEAGKQPFIEELPNHLEKFENMLKRNDGGKNFFVGQKISFVDYAMFDLLDDLVVLQGDCLDAFPLLKGFHSRMGGRPALAKYRDTEAFKTRPVNGNGKQ